MAGADLIIEVRRLLILALAEGGPGTALVRGDGAGHQGLKDGRAAEVHEEDGAIILDGREVHHKGQTRDKDARGEGRYKPQEKVPVGPYAQQISVLTAD